MAEDEGLSRLAKIRKFTSIECPIFLLVTSWAMAGTMIPDLIVFQTCRKIMGEEKKNSCDILHTDSGSIEAINLERIVQPYASYIIMCKSLVEGVFPALISLFLGPWSDRFGRKPLLIAAYTGPVMHFVSISFLSRWDVDPWLLLLAFVPQSLLGGACVLMLATFCYISDITNNENRAWRLAWFESCLSGGLVTGIFIGPLIYEKFGYTILFSVCALFSASALIYVVFFIPETVHPQTEQKFKNLLDFNLVKELILTSTKKKTGLNRKSLWGCILALALLIVVLNGELSIGYLFATARLGWDAIEYSYFKGLLVAVTIIGTLTGVKLFGGHLGFSDTALAMMATVSYFSASMISAFTFKSWHMYASLLANIFAGVAPPTIRSVLSKSVPPEDVGKVFSLTTSVEALLPLVCGPLYNLIYLYYMPPIYPSPAYLLSGTFILFIMIIIVFIERNIIERPVVINSIDNED